MSDLGPYENSAITTTQQFDTIIKMVLATVADSSGRVYADTYKSWSKYAIANGIDLLEINGRTVVDFLKSQQVSMTTRQRQLSAMRTMAQVLAVVDYANPMRRAAYESVKLVRAPKQNASGKERKRCALSSEQVESILDVWLADDLLSVRNQALIATMFASGARRAEIVALQWNDIDLDLGTIHIRHGKGNKERYAALFGDLAIRALEHWQKRTEGRLYVFCPVINGVLGNDKPITADTLYHVVEATGKLAGVVWKPHDSRRTLATELLDQGVPLSEVQKQLGHSQANTTMIYAQAGNAAERRKLASIRYGN